MKKELLDNMKAIVLIDSAALFTKFETSVALCHFQLCTQCSVLEINSGLLRAVYTTPTESIRKQT